MLKLTKQINVAILCGPYLPHGAFCGIFSPRLGRLKDGTFRSCLSYLAFFEINWREYDRNDNVVHQHLAVGHSFWYVVPHLSSTNVPSHPTL
jgi:hypothetical protein